MDKKLLLLGILPAVAAGCTEADNAKPKNVLFIMVDDMKPSLGCYDDPLAKTPAMDSLASDANLYSRAYCQQALSGPTRASIFTGLRPADNGVTELQTWIRKKHPDLVTLPQAFKNAGYNTQSVGKTFHGIKNTLDTLSWTSEPLNFRYTKADEYQNVINKTGKKAAAYEFSDAPEDDYLDIRIRKEAVRQLKRLASEDKPFFLAVGFLKPHLPFCAPSKYWDMYEDVDFGHIDTSRIVDAPEIAYHDSEELREYTDIPDIGEEISQEQLVNLKRAYYACVSYTDDNIGILIDELKSLGIYDDTVIVLLGDHGYHTGEQGMWCKATNYEAATKVALMIKDAGQEKGRKIDVPVEFLDIYPTLCGMCGVEGPDYLAGKDLTTLEEDGVYYAISQFPRPYAALHKAKLREYMGYSIRDDRWTYIEWYDKNNTLVCSELYDMENKIEEDRNIIDEKGHEETVSRLAGVLHSTYTDRIFAEK